MQHSLQHLFDNNRAWAARMEAERPGFFVGLAQQQSPQYLWIGCSDSRVPANEITGLNPGEVFVHRNIANVVVHSDLNALSVIQYAVDTLLVKHIMVVGHYGCGGVLAAARNMRVGLADNWLRHVKDVQMRYQARLNHLPQNDLENCLCELNVIEQVANVALSNVLQDAWQRGQEVAVHGWIYGLHDGLVKDLQSTIRRSDDIAGTVQNAATTILQGYKSLPR